MGRLRPEPPPSDSSPYRIVVKLSNGRNLRITRTPRGDIQLRVQFQGVTYPGPEFPDTDLLAVLEGIRQMSLKIESEGE